MDKIQNEASPEAIVSAAKTSGCKSIAFTYNDPVIFLEYARDVALEAREQNIKTVAVTAGYICEKPREEFFSFIDAANVDLKCFTDDYYKSMAHGDLKTVLDTLVYLKEKTNVWFEITTLVVPGQNDSDSELYQMTKWISENLGTDIPHHFTAFHPDYKMQDIQRTPIETLIKATEIAKSNGLKYVYTGNVHDPEHSSTFCSNCNEILIERDWYVLGKWNIKNKKCSNCATEVAGHFEDIPGTWGAKRQPIFI